METPSSEGDVRVSTAGPPPVFVVRHDRDLDGVPHKATGRFTNARDSLMRLTDIDPKSAVGMLQLRYRCRRILLSPTFDAIIGVIILMNAVSVGIEQTIRLKNGDTAVMEVIETLFLCIYIVELGSRFFAFGVKCFIDQWVLLDILLVAVGVISAWLLEPIFKSTEDLEEQLGPLMVLRSLRLLRLARTLRLLVKFREMWILVRGLLSSGSTMFYTLLMLTTILYVFSCISMEIITNHPKATGDEPDADFVEIVAMSFPDLPTTMLTLSQFITLDNAVYVYAPLIKLDPLLAPFFLTMVVVLSIVLMNLVTAVIVNSAMEQAMQDKEMLKVHQAAEKKKLVKTIREVFERLDEDNSGEVSRDEIATICDEDRDVLQELMGSADPVEIFDALDVDGSGDLGIEEFIDGIWQVSISKAPIEVKRMERQVEVMRKQLWQIGQIQTSLADSVADIQDSVCAKPVAVGAASQPAAVQSLAPQPVVEAAFIDSDGKMNVAGEKDVFPCEKAQNGCTGMSTDRDSEVRSMAHRLFKESENVSQRLKLLLGEPESSRKHDLGLDKIQLSFEPDVAGEDKNWQAASALPSWARKISHELEQLRLQAREGLQRDKAGLSDEAAKRNAVDAFSGWTRPDDVYGEAYMELSDKLSHNRQRSRSDHMIGSNRARSRSGSMCPTASFDLSKLRPAPDASECLPSRDLRRAKKLTMTLAARKPDRAATTTSDCSIILQEHVKGASD
eukprot:TRINITY_DN38258_c1_g2_i1.p1 TRINITY_DN38258_c1_g2~~TRINITY_DN38258_c1_g2_i1.p1  ORF type:complete len:731 (-),score=147.44 TRINITY_DN38258_c1_g2_i1:556-2748(-)